MTWILATLLAWWLALYGYFVAPVVNLFKDRHDAPFALPSRAPPDPELFPYYMESKTTNLWLYWRRWLPLGTPLAECRAVVVLVQGLGEHTARYDGLAVALAERGFAVFALDHQGQGNSEGDRMHVARFADFVDDMEQFVAKIVDVRHPELSGAPRFLLGHSMGGLIAAHLAIRRPSAWRGVVLSGPALEPDPKVATPLLRTLARVLGNVAPKLGVDSLGLEKLSRNKAVVELAYQDPAYPKRAMRARWAAETLAAMDFVWQNLGRATLQSLLVLHGAQDAICAISGSRRLIKGVPCTDKRIVEYPGMLHEIFTDPAHAIVKADVINFMNERL